MVAAGAAAVLAVYAAGYTRTRSAADQFDAQSAERRSTSPGGRGSVPSTAQSLPASPALSAPEASPAVSASSVPARGEREHAVQVASLNPPSVGPESTSAEHKTEAAPATPDPVAPPPVVTPAPATPTPAPAVASVAPPATAVSKWKDGTYTGWGSCRHGDIQAQIIIAGGRITSATIAQCLTRYSCDIIGRLPPEVLQRQSPEVDYVSGATQSADAFFYAVSDALGKAK